MYLIGGPLDQFEPDGFAAASAMAPGERLMTSIGGPLSDPNDFFGSAPRDRIPDLLAHQGLRKGRGV